MKKFTLVIVFALTSVITFGQEPEKKNELQGKLTLFLTQSYQHKNLIKYLK